MLELRLLELQAEYTNYSASSVDLAVVGLKPDRTREEIAREYAEILAERDAGKDSLIAALRKEVAAAKTPRSYLPSEGVSVGEGTNVHPTCVLVASDGRDIVIGSRTLIRRGAEMVGPITIGSGCSFNRDAYVRANVQIGDNVNIGAFARLVTDTHALAGKGRRAGKVSFPGIKIGDGVFIGIGVTVLGGVTIGDGAVVAAGSLVRDDVAPNTVVAGVPAKLKRTLSGSN